MATVSIILPTFNRARFLPQAFEAIRAQTYADWELIVIDDGSTDDTQAAVAALSGGVPQHVRYEYQQNQGAYGARNTGLDLAQGRYVAFYDSDDLWLPHHLEDCVTALETHPELDWVYGACRRVDLTTGEVLAANAFYENGRPRPFLKLRHRSSGRLRIIVDPAATRCMIRHGLLCGLQNSLLRQRIFADRRFDTSFRNESEDQLMVVRALAAGCRLAYYDDVHVIYRVHQENSSASAQGLALEKRLALLLDQARGYEELAREVALPRAERRAVDRRLAEEYFWTLGYAVLWQNGRRHEALEMFRKGLTLWPWSLRCWKTYCLAQLRAFVSRNRKSWPDTPRPETVV
jgi:glycosyltransferase involved in cell wall biosynthesis